MAKTSSAAEVAEIPDYNRIVAGNIRAELAREDISQSKVATALGVTEMWISRRLKGSTALDANDVKLFADYLKVSVGYLFETKKAPERSGGGDARGLRYLLPDLDSNQEPAG